MARAKCPRCQRPVKLCYCSRLVEETACMDLLILQHPSETKHPLNSARIAELGIHNCSILTGENFQNHPILTELLETRKTCLLFPCENAQSAQQIMEQCHPPELCIILDGTWRKARKIYYLNPALQQLPAITLSHSGKTDYRIRKAPDESCLSTIEASVALLREIDHNPSAHQNCLDTFTHMIDLQIRAMGKDVYRQKLW